MFIDNVTIKIQSGNGGHGAATFRREKFVAHGGPDGGDGGNGGSVYLEASDDLSTLLDFRYQSIYKAEDGEKGSRSNCHGARGKDLTIKVPCGTIVRDPNADLNLADLTKIGDRVLVAEGGRGGRGNTRFKSNGNKAPGYREPGELGIEREISLELKMIADAGIIGFPNAGKSTLISMISAAKPKIADYAFTTLKPNLGVVKKDSGDGFVVADIPGLIEGASDGVGLGHEFLRHIERTRLLVHVVDAWGFMAQNMDEYDSLKFSDPLENYKRVNLELKNYSEKLARKPQILVLNKIEAFPEEDLQELRDKFNDYLKEQNKIYEEFKAGTFQEQNPDEIYWGVQAVPANNLAFFEISAATGDGVDKLKQFICQAIDEIEAEETDIEIDYDPIATDHDDSDFRIEKDFNSKENEIVWNVHCGKLERVMKLTDIRDIESLSYLFKVAKGLGVFDAVRAQGAEPGDSLNIDGVDFELTEANLSRHVKG